MFFTKNKEEAFLSKISNLKEEIKRLDDEVAWILQRCNVFNKKFDALLEYLKLDIDYSEGFVVTKRK